MRVYIDCEFNGFGGELISMALVAEDGREFYEVLECKEPCEWVKKNVIPFLNKRSVNDKYFKMLLRDFINSFDSIELIADWPDDISHFCKAILVGPGLMMKTPPVTMRIVNIDSLSSEMPHNALCDAQALKKIDN